MKILDEATFTLISEKVLEECQERNVDGVFAMMSANTHDWVAYWRLIRRVGPIDQASDGNRYNLMAIAFSKLSFVMAHHRNSGGQTNVIGELPYIGGRQSEDKEVIYAFSGAAEEVDDEICKVAEEFHKTLPSELRQ
jgi:hypothetical protein